MTGLGGVDIIHIINVFKNTSNFCLQIEVFRLFHGRGESGDARDARHLHVDAVVGRALAHALFYVLLELVAPLEFAAAQLAGVAGRDAALVAQVAAQRALVQVAAAAPPAPILVGGGIVHRFFTFLFFEL